MKRIASKILILASIGLVAGCAQQRHSSLAMRPGSISRTERKPEMSREEVLQKFRERASSNELQKFEQLRRTNDAKSQTQASEMVLFKLTSDELFKIGLNQVELSGRNAWLVALSEDSNEVIKAVWKILEPLNIEVGTSYNLGMCGWSVHTEEFFRAQKALLAATNLQELGVEVHRPLFDLE